MLIHQLCVTGNKITTNLGFLCDSLSKHAVSFFRSLFIFGIPDDTILVRLLMYNEHDLHLILKLKI